MSIVIDGYKINLKNNNIKNLMNFCEEYGKLVVSEYDKKVRQLITKLACIDIDVYQYNNYPYDKDRCNDPIVFELFSNTNLPPLSKAYFKIMDDINKVERNNENNRMTDILQCELKIFQSSDEQILGILESDIREYRDMFEEMDIVQGYEYYDNTDRPDNITENEWNQRYNTWKSTGIFNIPSNSHILSCELPLPN